MSSLPYEDTKDSIIVSFVDVKILDDTRIQQISKELMDLADRASSQKKKMVLDFQDVQFMSSAMLGRLILLNKKAKADMVDLRLSNIAPNVLEVFKITRLNKVFKIGDDDV